MSCNGGCTGRKLAFSLTLDKRTHLSPVRETRVAQAETELYSVLHEPSQSFLAGFKGRKFATGKALHVLGEQLRKVLCSHPCGSLDIGFVEDRCFLHNPSVVTPKPANGGQVKTGQRQE